MSDARQEWTPEALAQAADRLYAAFRRARTQLVTDLEIDLSPAKVALLEPLTDADSLPVGRLAELAGITVPTVTRQLQQLDREGVIVRRRDPADDRRVLVSLTSSGRTRLESVRSVLRSYQTKGYESLSAGDRADLGHMMSRLAEMVEGASHPQP